MYSNWKGLINHTWWYILKTSISPIHRCIILFPIWSWAGWPLVKIIWSITHDTLIIAWSTLPSMFLIKIMEHSKVVSKFMSENLFLKMKCVFLITYFDIIETFHNFIPTYKARLCGTPLFLIQICVVASAKCSYECDTCYATAPIVAPPRHCINSTPS